MNDQNVRVGILLMVCATMVFACQDGISRHLADTYNTHMIVMVRYWAFAGFVILLALRREGGLPGIFRTKYPKVQILRGVVLAVEIVVAVTAFTILGLVESLAIFISYPLIIAALSGVVLGERVGWRRWIAICAGLVGVLILLAPGSGVFQVAAIIPLISAFLFAIYGLLTRYVAREDPSAVSLFYTGFFGAIIMTSYGFWFWEPMALVDWGWMATLSATGVLGHWLMIQAYARAEASALQPFAYLHFPFAALVGVIVFTESITLRLLLGSAIVILAGLFTLWRERQSA